MIEKKYTITNIDFSTPKGDEFLTGMYGDAACMREKLPLFAEDMERMRKLHAVGEGLSYETIFQKSEESRQAFDDGVDISWMAYDPERGILSIQARTSLNRRALYIDECLIIMDGDGKPLYRKRQSGAYTYEGCLELDYPFQWTIHVGHLTVSYYSVWKDEKSGIIKAQEYELNAMLTALPVSCVDSIHMVFPGSKENEKAVVSYGRSVSDGDLHIDRRYDLVYVNGLPELYLGLEGQVKFKADIPGFSRINLSAFQMKLIGKGMATYSIQDRDQKILSSFIQENDGFSIMLQDVDWKCTIPAERCTYKQDVDFLMTTEFYLSDGREHTICKWC